MQQDSAGQHAKIMREWSAPTTSIQKQRCVPQRCFTLGEVTAPLCFLPGQGLPRTTLPALILFCKRFRTIAPFPHVLSLCASPGVYPAIGRATEHEAAEVRDV